MSVLPKGPTLDEAFGVLVTSAPTMHLRWRFLRADREGLPILEQAWQLSNGSIEWREVPFVAWDAS